MAGDAGTDPGTDAAALYEHLAATETLPVDREAGWYLGEAQALAADVANGDLDDDVGRKRAAEVRELLAAFGGTGDSTADDHVAAARGLADRIAGRSDPGTGSEPGG